MFDTVKTKAVGLVDTAGRFLSRITPLHPLDDPAVWRRSAAYDPPADVDIEAAQRWIDSTMGTTRGGQPIYKLIWNGDRRYWYQFHTKWYRVWPEKGQPIGEPMRRPRVRYKVDRSSGIRDVFPPRWLILTRIEPEQYADTWKRESWVWDPELGGKKMIRPDAVPDVFWVLFHIVASHSAYCCAQSHRDQHMCYGKYASPYSAQKLLEGQRAADLAIGNRAPFEKIDGSFVSAIEDEYNGYANEMAALQVESEIFTENPMALLGIEASLRAGVNAKEAQRIVTEHYDREKQELSKLI